MSEVSRIVKERLEKIEELKAAGHNLYGGKFPVSETIDAAREGYKEGNIVTLAGRLMAIRAHGKSSFADLVDSTARVQIYVQLNTVGEDPYALFKKLDIGDIVGVTGEMLTSRTGEITVKVTEFTLLSKIVEVLPEKWHGLKDIEVRYRKRYIDLISSVESREIFKKRSFIVAYIRRLLTDKGFMEVETPVLQQIAGGAKAEPFTTHHNALHTDLFLRIAPELYLKKLLVGGFDKVFEIGKNFRNEGISVRHNPEFTMLELYQAYADYYDMMDITEEIVTGLVKELHDEMTIPYGDKMINFTGPWKRVSFYDALKEKTGVDFRTTPASEVVKKDAALKDEWTDKTDDEDFLDIAFDAYVLPDLIDPTFVIDYPAFMTPLAKKKEDDAELVYRFELFINGIELANAYSELNDPFDQRARFEAQRTQLGDEDKAIDEDFLHALDHAMPPAGGLGIGIDRLVMFLTNSLSIRDVILFPQLRPERKSAETEDEVQVEQEV